MNRKESKEQNDTSIIIGNLPQRLQRKFAENCSENKGNGFWKSSITKASGSKRAVKDKRDNLAVAGRTNPISKETSCLTGNAEGMCLNPKLQSDGVKKVCSILPGVLRLDNIMDIGEESRDQNVIKSEESRKNSPVHRPECLIRDVLPVSPARLPLKMTSQPSWFRNLDDIPVAKDLPQLYESLMSLIRRNALLLEWEYFCDIQNDLLEIFTEMLLQHLKFVCEQKVDTFFWKLLFYNIREYLKTQPSSEASEVTLSIIENGQKFYEKLHNMVDKKYFQNKTQGDAFKKFQFIAKVIDQKILICLGDLSRYRTKHKQLLDYGEAFKYYQEAQRLIPTNAIPYNQLAIVSLHARKQFDAVYFHMRSLMSSNPIYSAKESLLVMFDEIGKKFEESEVKISPLANTKRREKKRKNSYSRSMRKEVWIHPDGARLLHRTEIQEDEEDSAVDEEYLLKDLPLEEVTKRLISHYLYVIGKLYSGVGMESIEAYERKLFAHFAVSLNESPMMIKRNRLLKIVALNIFIVEHNMSQGARREVRYHAFNFCNQIFGLVLRKCSELLSSDVLNIQEKKDKEIFYDLNTLLQVTRVYVKWLVQNVAIWEPSRSKEQLYVDCWYELNVFFDKISYFLSNINEDNCSEDQAVIFEEDNFLLGFTPLSIAYNKHESIQDPSDECSQFLERLKQILSSQQFFKENEKLLKNYHQEDGFSHDVTCSSFEKYSDSDDLGSSDDDNMKNNENVALNGMPKELKCNKNLDNEDDQIKELAKLKKELEAKSNYKKIYNAKLQEILNFVDVRLRIEVRPKYLLPDTNCFIDYIKDFERLVQEFKGFILIVPLTVVKELEGLSKGVKIEGDEKYSRKNRIHHYDDVSSNAKKSLEFIKSSKNGVKCATTKGSIINSSLFDLVDEEYATNDDKILATALSLSKTMSNEVTKDGKCLIRTELVLITTDRNLRVKALSRNLAVSELNEFLQWAKDCKK